MSVDLTDRDNTMPDDVISSLDLDKLRTAVQNLQAPNVDNAARSEENDLFGDRGRAEVTREELHKSFILFIRTATYAMLVLFAVRLLHFVLPQVSSSACVHGWLTDEQIHSIDKFCFSGALGAIMSRYLRSAFPDMPKSKSSDELDGKRYE